MSRWYGLREDWMDVGLPTYRGIARKPEMGAKLTQVHAAGVE